MYAGLTTVHWISRLRGGHHLGDACGGQCLQPGKEVKHRAAKGYGVPVFLLRNVISRHQQQAAPNRPSHSHTSFTCSPHQHIQQQQQQPQLAAPPHCIACTEPSALQDCAPCSSKLPVTAAPISSIESVTQHIQNLGERGVPSSIGQLRVVLAHQLATGAVRLDETSHHLLPVSNTVKPSKPPKAPKQAVHAGKRSKPAAAAAAPAQGLVQAGTTNLKTGDITCHEVAAIHVEPPSTAAVQVLGSSQLVGAPATSISQNTSQRQKQQHVTEEGVVLMDGVLQSTALLLALGQPRAAGLQPNSTVVEAAVTSSAAENIDQQISDIWPSGSVHFSLQDAVRLLLEPGALHGAATSNCNQSTHTNSSASCQQPPTSAAKAAASAKVSTADSGCQNRASNMHSGNGRTLLPWSMGLIASNHHPHKVLRELLQKAHMNMALPRQSAPQCTQQHVIREMAAQQLSIKKNAVTSSTAATTAVLMEHDDLPDQQQHHHQQQQASLPGVSMMCGTMVMYDKLLVQPDNRVVKRRRLHSAVRAACAPSAPKHKHALSSVVSEATTVVSGPAVHHTQQQQWQPQQQQVSASLGAVAAPESSPPQARLQAYAHDAVVSTLGTQAQVPASQAELPPASESEMMEPATGVHNEEATVSDAKVTAPAAACRAAHSPQICQTRPSATSHSPSAPVLAATNPLAAAHAGLPPGITSEARSVHHKRSQRSPAVAADAVAVALNPGLCSHVPDSPVVDSNPTSAQCCQLKLSNCQEHLHDAITCQPHSTAAPSATVPQSGSQSVVTGENAATHQRHADRGPVSGSRIEAQAVHKESWQAFCPPGMLATQQVTVVRMRDFICNKK